MQKTFFLILICCSITISGCIAPQYFWPQKDLTLTEINQPIWEKNLLIASRDSEFKQAVVEKIINAFRDQLIYLKIIGIESLKQETAENYSAVVILSTCMAWTSDPRVESFLSSYGKSNSIIVLTTSDGGDILAKTEAQGIDAMSSASLIENIDPIADQIIQKLNTILQ